MTGPIAASGNTVFRDYAVDGVPASGPNQPAKSDIRALFVEIDQLIDTSIYTPKVFGALGDGVTNDRVAVQAAIDALNALYVVDGVARTLWFDTVYIVGGAKHANGFSIIDLKSGVNFDGPGGMKLAANTNVAASVFSATFSGTTMTVTAVTSGTWAPNQFLSAAGRVLPAAVQIVSQLTGSGLVVGATFQVSANCGTIASPVVVSGCSRMVEMMGNYSSSPSPGIVNTTYRNILLDYNGANNCAGGTIWSWNSTISIQTADSVVFDGLRFRNNGGSNDIVLGLLQTTLTAFRCRVINCSFQNVSTRVNASSRDYSTIVANGAHIGISCNTFALGPTLNGVAVELYGLDVNANGNTVSGYWAFSNVAGLPGQTSKNISLTGNTIQDCNVGIVLWTMDASAKLQGVAIVGNSFDCNLGNPGGPYFINGVEQVTAGSEIRDLLIEANVFQNNDLSDTARNKWGIGLFRVLSATICGNMLSGISGEGIYITGTLDPCAITITNNHLINVGYTSASAANKTGITIDASGSTGSLLIQGNVINPMAGYTLTFGIKNRLSVSGGQINGNVVLLATTPVDNTGVGVRVTVVGQIPGTATNDVAIAGNVGEYVESVIASGSAVALTTATPKTITSISLTAGDWDVSALGSISNSGANFTQFGFSLSGTTNTLDTTPGKLNFATLSGGTAPGGSALNVAIPSYKLRLAAPTTVYLVSQATFTGGTAAAFGIISARRPR